MSILWVYTFQIVCTHIFFIVYSHTNCSAISCNLPYRMPLGELTLVILRTSTYFHVTTGSQQSHQNKPNKIHWREKGFSHKYINIWHIEIVHLWPQHCVSKITYSERQGSICSSNLNSFELYWSFRNLKSEQKELGWEKKKRKTGKICKYIQPYQKSLLELEGFQHNYLYRNDHSLDLLSAKPLNKQKQGQPGTCIIISKVTSQTKRTDTMTVYHFQALKVNEKSIGLSNSSTNIVPR